MRARHFASLLLVAAMAVAGCANTTGPSGTGGAPTLAPSSPTFFSQTIGDRVLFDVDQATLNNSARTTLDGQARWLMANGTYTALIEGHADEQGTREYNLALGARRASAVQEYLIAQGVAPTRLSTVTFGKERPLEVCSEESCYARNRRAVTVLAGGAGT